MTIKELIEKLEKYPKDMKVEIQIWDEETQEHVYREVDLKTMFSVPDNWSILIIY